MKKCRWCDNQAVEGLSLCGECEESLPATGTVTDGGYGLLFNCNNCKKQVQQLDQHCSECGTLLPMYEVVDNVRRG